MARKKKEETGINTPLANRLQLIMDGREGDPLFEKKPRGDGKKLAEYLGMSKQTISMYKNGSILPEVPTLEKIADYYHTSTDWLLGRFPEDCKSLNAETQRMAEHTGLSQASIEALIMICKGTEHFDPDVKGKEFIDMALRQVKIEIDKQEKKAKALHDQFIETGIEPDPTKLELKTVFDDFYRKVIPLDPDDKEKYQIHDSDMKGIKPEISLKDIRDYIASKNIRKFYRLLSKTVQQRNAHRNEEE
ncbi:MAG: helix-turn-helix transcriptional regulator [Lachnospiraceae bacterium]|nr:helix-turn-helix transcriptional regulator [Lachnospiraceae bacterium]